MDKLRDLDGHARYTSVKLNPAAIWIDPMKANHVLIISYHISGVLRHERRIMATYVKPYIPECGNCLHFPRGDRPGMEALTGSARHRVLINQFRRTQWSCTFYGDMLAKVVANANNPVRTIPCSVRAQWVRERP